MHTSASEIVDEFKRVVAERLRLEPSAIYGRSLTLADVIATSPATQNSVDLLEAIAGAMAELGIDDRIELPAMTLDHTLDELVAEVSAQIAEAAA